MSKKKPNFLRGFTTALDLPKELVFNLPRIVMLSNEEVYIENYKGIVNYTDKEIRLNTNKIPLKITGSSLEIAQITADDVTITGKICTIEFSN